jgi:selenophosphate synthase
MEHIVNAAINELKEELDEDVTAATEPSRFIRLMHLKYKCFVIFLLAFLATLTLVYITIKEVLKDEEAGQLMEQMFKMFSKAYFPNSTVDVSAMMLSQ